jgi:hypothetical protein
MSSTSSSVTLCCQSGGESNTKPNSISSEGRDDQASICSEAEKDLGVPVLEGWPLGSTVFAYVARYCCRSVCLQAIRLCLALLLATLDTTIISTSLITIASELGHFDQASWILVSYLLTYSGFLLIFTRLSDVLGRKPMLLFSISMFLVWSIGCGFSQTLTQL